MGGGMGGPGMGGAGMHYGAGGERGGGKPHRPDNVVPLCRDFMRSRCSRDACTFAHPGKSVQIDEANNTVTLCMDYRLRECTRQACRFYHAPVDNREGEGFGGGGGGRDREVKDGDSGRNRVKVCRDFVKGECMKSSCSLPHPNKSVQVDESSMTATVCMDYRLRGCTRDSCRFYHASLSDQ
eukprot:CAMPEP_0196598128 /NCGR_PEP_ID=MMETSP1081-20130531/94139_1 /TAXON_ID=36882 /ORGANISM="Pyramimonas amylifera, Strain CCMP720" /LENGTH=181 /DNA_ID=CAMNT_0041923775 /DNA_START=625 /DNA_END=1170 /DNA_ORIENTATION=+